MSLRKFVRGHGVAPPSEGDAQGTASALLRSIDRAAAGKIDAHELGLLGLAEAVALPRDAEELAVYALTLSGLAERPFTRGLAFELASRRADLARVGARGVYGRTIDWLALTLGLLRAGHSIATAFTRERVLFRRLLGDNAVVRARHSRHVERMDALNELLLHVIGRHDDPEVMGDLPFFRFFAATEAVTIVNEQMQMMGGTGFMRDSGMPAVRDSILSLIESHRPEMMLSDAHLLAWVGGQLPAWLAAGAGSAADAEEAAGERQSDLLRVLPRFVSACAEARAPRTAATG